jgi:NDP-sugar pyrophosphorylase family protein
MTVLIEEVEMNIGVLLAGGPGKRLQPYTDYLPKALLPIGCLPLIAHHLQAFESAGLKKALIVVEPRTASLLEKTVKLGYKGPLTIEYVIQQLPRGVGDAILCCASSIGDESFVYQLADEYVELPSNGFEKAARQGRCGFDIVLLLKRFRGRESGSTGNFVIIDKKHKLIREFIVSSGRQKRASLIAIGPRFVFNSSPFLNILKDLRRSEPDRIDLAAGFAIQKMIEAGYRVGYSVEHGYSQNVNTFGDFKRLFDWSYRKTCQRS